MLPDNTDTIAAIGSPRGGAARGMLRLSGPQTWDCLAACFDPSEPEFQLETVRAAKVVAGDLRIGDSVSLPCQVLLWPGERNYTRQPCAEVHTIGSPPLLEIALESLCQQGARIAEPGEFTLRAFLAGRLDLIQAEAVLGIIDATDDHAWQTALMQLAGGLSRPLTQLREQLLTLLAHLEAGLDFVEEDIQFISAEEIRDQLKLAKELVERVLEQLASRSQPSVCPRVVLLGAPNVGKSSLFNTLLLSCGEKHRQSPALVSEQEGTTRDYLSATVEFEGLKCELIDTAGMHSAGKTNAIESYSQEMTVDQIRQADCRVLCVETTDENLPRFLSHLDPTLWDCLAVTKSDLLPPAPRATALPVRTVLCSSLTGQGIPELREAIAGVLTESEKLAATGVPATVARCRESLQTARFCLESSWETLASEGAEELVAADLRSALDALGRVVGTVYTDDILDRIFSQFCIGK